MPTYAGIGSRKTPGEVGRIMGSFAYVAAREGYVLRTGGADGADTYFEAGARLAGANVQDGSLELFYPWPGFSGKGMGTLDAPTSDAYALAAEFHPRWHSLGESAQALIARNGHQILGPNLDDPVSFVVCWTPDGATTRTTARTGGTGQAIRIATAYDVPVLNIKRTEHFAEVAEIARNC